MTDKQVPSSDLEPQWVWRWLYPVAFVAVVLVSYFLAACGGGGDDPEAPCPDGYYLAEVGLQLIYEPQPHYIPITQCTPDGFDPWGQPLPKP